MRKSKTSRTITPQVADAIATLRGYAIPRSAFSVQCSRIWRSRNGSRAGYYEYGRAIIIFKKREIGLQHAEQLAHDFSVSVIMHNEKPYMICVYVPDSSYRAGLYDEHWNRIKSIEELAIL